MIREEWSRLFTFEERHRRLFARLLIAFVLSIVVFGIGSVLVWWLESGQKGGDINGFGDAAFFTAVQMLTVSSSNTNPLTAAGKIIDVGLEAVGRLRHHRSRRQLRHLLHLRRRELAPRAVSPSAEARRPTRPRSEQWCCPALSV